MYKNFSQSRLPIKTGKLLILITTALTTLLLVIGLPTVTTSPVVAQSNTSLLISAAASLKEVLVEIQPLYQQSQPNVNINYKSNRHFSHFSTNKSYCLVK